MRRLALTLLAGWILACSSTEPEFQTSLYDLKLVNGQSLWTGNMNTGVNLSGANCPPAILSGAILFANPVQVRVQYEVQNRCSIVPANHFDEIVSYELINGGAILHWTQTDIVGPHDDTLNISTDTIRTRLQAMEGTPRNEWLLTLHH